MFSRGRGHQYSPLTAPEFHNENYYFGFKRTFPPQTNPIYFGLVFSYLSDEMPSLLPHNCVLHKALISLKKELKIDLLFCHFQEQIFFN
jgi:hypothetical protein